MGKKLRNTSFSPYLVNKGLWRICAKPANLKKNHLNHAIIRILGASCFTSLKRNPINSLSCPPHSRASWLFATVPIRHRRWSLRSYSKHWFLMPTILTVRGPSLQQRIVKSVYGPLIKMMMMVFTPLQGFRPPTTYVHVHVYVKITACVNMCSTQFFTETVLCI